MNKPYNVEFDDNAKKSFKKLDKSVQRQILSWLNKNIEGSYNPRWTGKGLSADKQGLWRYRVGKYRIICSIQDDIAIVLVVVADKRETVYDFNLKS